MGYSDNKELYDTYIPFQTGYIYQEHGVMQKCEYCGKPNMNADCHAHSIDCPYYCGNLELPIGDGLSILITFVIGYFILKIIKKKVNNL